ncbi:hypothetical protein [Aeromonas veronii]|uniref:hypothetical protein n=1 Tax=Aeromonas veronii TaxID=654 RepID=UPI003D228009
MMKFYQMNGQSTVVVAAPMSRGEYLKSRGWAIPAGENPSDTGMRVYDGRVVSWMDCEVFSRLFKAVIPAPERSATPIRSAVGRFIRDAAVLFVSLAGALVISILFTYTGNQARIKDYRHLESKIDALAEAKGFQFVEVED